MAAIRLFFSSRALNKAHKKISNQWFQMRIRIQHFRTMRQNQDTISDTDQRIQKNWKILRLKNLYFSYKKIALFTSQVLHKALADPDPHCLTNWENITKNIKTHGNYLYMEEPNDEVFFLLVSSILFDASKHIFVYLTCFNLWTKNNLYLQ